AGDGDRQFGIAGHQLADHRRRRDALAHRNRMYPDTARFQLRQAKGEAFTDALGVSRRLPGAPEQAQENQWQAEVEQQGIKGAIHGGAVYAKEIPYEKAATVGWISRKRNP